MNQRKTAALCPPSFGGTPPLDGPETLQAASRRLRAQHIERVRHFPPELASGPPWDLLLELDDESEGACDSRWSSATRHRWLRVLAEHGLVTLGADHPSGARLSAAGRARIDGYLSACLEQGLL
jgi:hypothetical protein